MTSVHILNPKHASATTSVKELKSLLTLLADHQHAANIRFRLIGEMWQPTHMRVIAANDKAMAFKDEINDRVIVLRDWRMIIQFELDGSALRFNPHFHYDVVPD